MSNNMREYGFYWVRIDDEWSVGEWIDRNEWYVIGCEYPWEDPGLLGGSPNLDEIGPRIANFILGP